jgi:hypothetical protein
LRQWRIFAQQRIHPVFLPRLRNNGSAPRASRRNFAHKILDSAALRSLPARHSGDNLRIFATKSLLLCNAISLGYAFLFVLNLYFFLETGDWKLAAIR